MDTVLRSRQTFHWQIAGGDGPGKRPGGVTSGLSSFCGIRLLQARLHRTTREVSECQKLACQATLSVPVLDLLLRECLSFKPKVASSNLVGRIPDFAQCGRIVADRKPARRSASNPPVPPLGTTPHDSDRIRVPSLAK